MRDRKKQAQKEKKRERARRIQKQRRLEADLCFDLMIDAELAWEAGDFHAAERLLEKVLRIRPSHAEAHERLAELCFMRGRFEEGLAHYDKLSGKPRWPPVAYGAAVAAWNTRQIERCEKLVKEFLRSTRGSRQFPNTRADARKLAKACARVMKLRERGQMILPTEAHRIPPAGAHRAPLQAPRSGDGGSTESAAVVSQLELPPFPQVSLSDIQVQFEPDREAFESPPVVSPASAAEVFLRRDYALLRLQKGFDELLSPGVAKNLEDFWFQLETVRRVLRDFRGRVLLADEVGLGKTIEACLALKEYRMRGLVKKALILTPPSLIGQWIEELKAKFDMAAVSPEMGGYANDPDGFWSRHDLVVASLALARQPSNRERLSRIDYDLVIVDEAHYLKNRASSAWQLINNMKKRFLLLLSATPVGNNLSELYNLILLLRPGLLKTEAQFRRDFGRHGALEDPARREKLRGLLREVMVRNTRAHIDLKLPRRLAATERVQPEAVEMELLEDFGAYIRSRYPAATPAERLRLMTLQMQAGSSPAALRYGLRNYQEFDTPNGLRAVVEKLGSVHTSGKTRALVELVRRSPEKKIVFTRFLATLEEVRHTLEGEGWHVAVFHGGLTAAEKDAVIEEFRDRAEILVSSESGGEGRNLQFCNTVINYDLPWNPMTIEQRVGRVHRIGQTREVYVFNFCLAGSVEEYMLKVLHDKINLFELVAGEIEMILGELDQEQDFASIVMDLWARSPAPGERQSAFDQLAQQIQAAKEQYQKTRELDHALFGEDYEV